MLSDEEKEILNNIKEYMQNDIDKGYHKFVYNDLGSDFKCIDCINAIDNVLNLIEKQSKEIEELKENKGYHLGFIDGGIAKRYEMEEKIKEKIEEYEKMKEATKTDTTYYGEKRRSVIEALIAVLQSLLKEE